MPTRTLIRKTEFSLDEIYSTFLSSAPGWGSATADIINSATWDNVNKTLTFEKIIEPPQGNSKTVVVRRISLSAVEIYSLVSSLPGWSGGTVTDLNKVEFDSAGRKIKIIKVSELA